MEAWLEDELRIWLKDRYYEDSSTYFIDTVADEAVDRFNLDLNEDDRIELEYLVESVLEEVLDSGDVNEDEEREEDEE